jgi:hypothetical protein
MGNLLVIREQDRRRRCNVLSKLYNFEDFISGKVHV